MNGKLLRGIYALFKDDCLVYVGQSNNITYRVGTHIQNGEKDFDTYEVFPVPGNMTNADLNELEAETIRYFSPKYNKALAMGKGHKCKTKTAYVKSINRIVNNWCMSIEDEPLPQMFCFCKDCAYNVENVNDKADIHPPHRHRLYEQCFASPRMAKMDGDGCMRGLPMDECKYYTKGRYALSEEQLEYLSSKWGTIDFDEIIRDHIKTVYMTHIRNKNIAILQNVQKETYESERRNSEVHEK